MYKKLYVSIAIQGGQYDRAITKKLVWSHLFKNFIMNFLSLNGTPCIVFFHSVSTLEVY